MKKLFSITFVSILLAVTLNSQTVWKVDKAHSVIKFNISHMVIAEVTGRFTEFDVTLTNQKDDFSDSKLNATIKSASINTDNEGRDKHLRSADFFEVEKFPEITFTSKSFEKTGKDTYKITGDLKMHDTIKTIVLDTKFNGIMTDPWGNTRAGFKATTTINRKDFGILWNKTLDAGGVLVGEDVEVIINVELVKEKK